MSSVENQIVDLNDAEIADVDGGILVTAAAITAGVIVGGGGTYAAISWLRD